MKSINIVWFQKRFFEFRAGNNIYIGFSIALVNFILISYRFSIENSEIGDIIPDLVMFAIIFLIVYIPLTLVVGHWHYKTQEKVVNTMQFIANPGIIRALRLMFELKTNTANLEDVERFKKLLKELGIKSSTKEFD